MNDDLIQRMRLLEADHQPDGWPAVQMRDVTALVRQVERFRDALQVIAPYPMKSVDERSAKSLRDIARAALIGFTAPPSPTVPDDMVLLPKRMTREMQCVVEREEWDWADLLAAAGAVTEAEHAAILTAPPSPTVPEGYAILPLRLTYENGAKGLMIGEFTMKRWVDCTECAGDTDIVGSCSACDGVGSVAVHDTIDWTTIKAIWHRAAQHFAAAPEPNRG